MADLLDPAALRKTAESIMEGCAFPNCQTCTLARALLQHLDREAAAQQVLATMAPRLEEIQSIAANPDGGGAGRGGELQDLRRHRAYLLTAVDALALRAARDEACRDNAERNCDDLRETYLKVKAERDAARQQLAEAARLLRCQPDQVLARLEQIAAAQPPDVAAMEGRAQEVLEKVEYRPGLPPVEAVRAHEERGGWWMACPKGSVAHLTHLGPRLHILRHVPGMRYRPCTPDGTPCAWPEPNHD